MPLNSTSVGTAGETLTHEVDARWTMSYAAGIGDTLDCYMDTRRPGGVVAHPVFPACLEWPVIVALRGHPVNAALSRDEFRRNVHATHEVVSYRLVRPGDRLTTRATIVGVERRRSGAFQTIRLDTMDAQGERVCSTWQAGLYRGVEVDGPARSPSDLPTSVSPAPGDGPVRAEIRVPLSAVAAHVYTECARIWNPIHTDLAVAEAAGLPGLILHGTATLAIGVSQVIEHEADRQPQRVRRIAGRFGAMVVLPSAITVRILSRQSTSEGTAVRFEVHSAEGKLAVRDGLVVLG